MGGIQMVCMLYKWYVCGVCGMQMSAGKNANGMRVICKWYTCGVGGVHMVSVVVVCKVANDGKGSCKGGCESGVTGGVRERNNPGKLLARDDDG
jgi:hypothetical protein